MSADNQQRRLSRRLGWLGGVIDGEGMITVVKRSKGNSYYPRISIANSDITLINEVISIFEELKMPYYLQSKQYDVDGKNRIKYEILVNGLTRCCEVLPVILPFLISKKER